MALGQRNHEVQAFPPDGSDQPFAECIRLWSSDRSLEGPHTKRSDGHVQFGGESRMSVMKEEPVCMIARDRISELLHRPIGCGPGGHIAMKDAAGADLHDHEYIKDTETGGDRDHEVACQQDSGMIADKRRPVLRSETRIARFVLSGPVRSNRPRRNADAQLQPELIGDALFAPGRIVQRHSSDHVLKLGRQPWTTDATRFPLPKQSERLAMPTDQRCRLNKEKSGFPPKEAGPENQREASRIRESSWPDLVLLVEGQLLAKKQILGNQRRSRMEG